MASKQILKELKDLQKDPPTSCSAGKSGAAPLAFNSIKSGVGAVPVTYVGIQRIYPVLYRERLSSGEYYTRSERMEAKMLESYNQRRSDVVEGVMSELHKRLELLEGQACAVSGLVAGSSNSDTLYLQARGSTTKWLQLSPSTIQLFQPFYNPRKPISLYKFNDVPLNSEFDITGHVVFVGEVYTAARQRKQWVFVTDRSVNEPHFKTPYNNIFAICFCEPSIGHDSSALFSYNLAGSTQ